MRSYRTTPTSVPRTAAILTVLVLVLLPVATAVGLFVSGFYRDAATMIPQARGQDLVTFAVAEPLLFGALVAARRGYVAAPAIWSGALGYVLYTYAMYSYTAYFNALFLVYVALFSASLFAVVDLLIHLNATQLEASIRSAFPARAIAVFLAVVGLLFLLAWLGQIVPATLRGTVPDAVAQAKTPTSSVYVQDLGIVIPLLLMAARCLWQRRAMGYVLSISLLVMMDVMLLALLSMALFMAQANLLNSLAMAWLFALLTITSLGFTALCFAHIERPMNPETMASPDMSAFGESSTVRTESRKELEHARDAVGAPDR